MLTLTISYKSKERTKEKRQPRDMIRAKHIQSNKYKPNRY